MSGGDVNEMGEKYGGEKRRGRRGEGGEERAKRVESKKGAGGCICYLICTDGEMREESELSGLSGLCGLVGLGGLCGKAEADANANANAICSCSRLRESMIRCNEG